MTVIFLLLVCLVGASTPIQTAINSCLEKGVGSPFAASLVQFTVGLLFMVILTVATVGPTGAHIAFEGPWYAWAGGLTGVIGLTSFIILFPRIGGIQTVLLPIVGQLITGITIDHFGAFGIEPRPVSVVKLSALAVSLAGVCFVVIRKGEDSAHVKSKWIWQVLGVVAGAMIATQSAANGMLGGIVGSPILASMISFLISTLFLSVLVLSMKESRSGFGRVFGVRRPWWHWTGGIIGGLIVTGYAFFTPILGVGITSIVSILGQLGMSVAIDRFGLIGAQKVKVGILQYIGVLLVLAGSVLIYL